MGVGGLGSGGGIQGMVGFKGSFQPSVSGSISVSVDTSDDAWNGSEIHFPASRSASAYVNIPVKNSKTLSECQR